MGSMNLACTMVKAAQEAGAEIAKFQYWKEHKLEAGPWDHDGRRDIYYKAELSLDNLRTLAIACRDANIQFLCSCFDKDDAHDLTNVSDSIKIPSHEATNQELIKCAIDNFDKVYISLGATTSAEKEYIRQEYKSEAKRITVMYCVSAYPMALHSFKLDTYRKIRDNFLKYGYPVGYSGHHSTIHDAVIAMAEGADVIEKHFTIDKTLPGRDNKFALDPKELESLCWLRDELSLAQPSQVYEYLPEEQEVRDVYSGRWSKGKKK